MRINRVIPSWAVAAVGLAASIAISLAVTATVAMAQLGTVVLAELGSVPVIAALALLVWAAIQDGRPRDEVAVPMA